MSRSADVARRAGSRLLLAGALATVLAVPVTNGTDAGALPASLCRRATPAEVSPVLGVKATKVTARVLRSVTVYW